MWLGTKLYKFACKFRASSLQVPFKLSTRAMQEHCMKTCNAFELQVPKEEFVNFILSASELHENVQHKSVARFCATLLQVSR